MFLTVFLVRVSKRMCVILVPGIDRGVKQGPEPNRRIRAVMQHQCNISALQLCLQHGKCCRPTHFFGGEGVVFVAFLPSAPTHLQPRSRVMMWRLSRTKQPRKKCRAFFMTTTFLTALSAEVEGGGSSKGRGPSRT